MHAIDCHGFVLKKHREAICKIGKIDGIVRQFTGADEYVIDVILLGIGAEIGGGFFIEQRQRIFTCGIVHTVEEQIGARPADNVSSRQGSDAVIVVVVG
ncbi:hypothetical protein SDC9_178369 [bioreactor metagenome]|uniref:Uncharacterized protein n=1 Tax=bioreactor metagenome TaxID=1076179 RepID=A0A645GVQ9_9ZZZZ